MNIRDRMSRGIIGWIHYPSINGTHQELLWRIWRLPNTTAFCIIHTDRSDSLLMMNSGMLIICMSSSWGHQTQHTKNNLDHGNFMPKMQVCDFKCEVQISVMLLLNLFNYIAAKRGMKLNDVDTLIRIIKIKIRFVNLYLHKAVNSLLHRRLLYLFYYYQYIIVYLLYVHTLHNYYSIACTVISQLDIPFEYLNCKHW